MWFQGVWKEFEGYPFRYKVLQGKTAGGKECFTVQCTNLFLGMTCGLSDEKTPNKSCWDTEAEAKANIKRHRERVMVDIERITSLYEGDGSDI